MLSTKSTHITHKYVSELKNIQKFYTKLMYSAGYDITCSAHTADLELPNKDGNNRVVSGIVAKSAKKKKVKKLKHIKHILIDVLFRKPEHKGSFFLYSLPRFCG